MIATHADAGLAMRRIRELRRDLRDKAGPDLVSAARFDAGLGALLELVDRRAPDLGVRQAFAALETLEALIETYALTLAPDRLHEGQP